jgi:hypothetical protein
MKYFIYITAMESLTEASTVTPKELSTMRLLASAATSGGGGQESFTPSTLKATLVMASNAEERDLLGPLNANTEENLNPGAAVVSLHIWQFAL